MTLTDANNILSKTYGEHLDKVYVPSLQRYVMFRPLTTAHVKLLARSQFIDNFELPAEILKLSLFDKLVVEDLSKEEISSKTITMFDYLAFLIGIRQILDINLKFKFTCKCKENEKFEEELHLDELFDDIISDFKPQTEIFEKVDEKTNIIWKFELKNFTMLDYLYYKHILFKLTENNLNDPNIINTDKFLRPLLYINKIYMNEEEIEGWKDLLLTEKLDFFNKISPKITLNDSENKTLIAFIKETFAEEKLIDFVKNIVVECPNCHKKYRRVYDIDNFFMF